MDYKLIRRKGQKNIRMHFNDEGVLIVSAPYYARSVDIESFVLSNSDWIYKQLHKQQKHSFSTGDSLYFFGKKYDLVVNQSIKDSVEILDNLMVVFAKNTDSEYITELLKKYYSRHLNEYAVARTAYWTDKAGLAAPLVRICNAKSRWGVCFKNRNLIKISLMACSLSKELIDMIVLHEICHLVYPNHQKDFWNLMKRYMPDVEDRKKALRVQSREGYHKNLFN